jgi:hypothetical protein
MLDGEREGAKKEQAQKLSARTRLRLLTGRLLYWRSFPSEIVALRIGRRRWKASHATRESNSNPLVSVLIPTWNRAELLTERTVPSVLAQTYRNFELVIVGDHCEDDTARRLAQLGDPRIRFHNLPERGKYPQKAEWRWRVAGTTPGNKCLELARGEWLSYLDDDDVYTPDHIEVLLRFAQERRLEFAYAACDREVATGDWLTIKDTPHRRGFDVYRDPEAWGNGVAHSTWFYRSYLRAFKYDILSWWYDSYADQSAVMRMGRAGVRAGYLDRVVASMPLRPGEVVQSQGRFASSSEIEAEQEAVRARLDVLQSR